jgi:hypothetical protein
MVNNKTQRNKSRANKNKANKNKANKSQKGGKRKLSKKLSAWNKKVMEIYHAEKKKNSSFSLRDAMIKAKNQK